MRNEGDARTFLLRRVSASTWLTIAILAAGGLLATWFVVVREPVANVPTANQGATDLPTTERVPGAESPEIQIAAPLTAEAVIADPQCRMVVGQRTASDTALVYLPLEDGAWFAVVNTFGVVFDGTLPFVPRRPQVGKRLDGTILVGFNLEDDVQIVHDGSVIYEFDDVWSFDIADDGSSFFVVEPLAGDASRLVIRNLELREEHHFDLGTNRFAKTARKVREFKVEPGAEETEESFAIRTSLDPGAPSSCNHALLDRRLEIRDGRLTYGVSDY